jgi:uncharacterized repeat protein (TIGR01451 family)
LGCALWLSGCANWQFPRLDPTGERVFAPAGAPVPPFPPGAAPIAPPVGPNTGLSLSPSALIAPVGSEVVMIASVVGGEGFLLTNEVVEWTIDPGGVGQFLSTGERRRLDLINWWRGLPRKIDSRFAVNATLRNPMTLDRGTPSPLDDLFVQTGQAWVTVASPVEGTSRVTAFAPALSAWELRQQTATIYWIDAQWRLPPPAITALGGRNTLSTSVMRQTNGAPLAGWQVRYEIAGGPPAGFAPDGAASVQVVTNESGQAAVEIFQNQPAPGTNQINISIIQPMGPAGQGQSLTVGAGSVLQTWASAAAPGPTAAPLPGAPATAPPTFVPAPSEPAPAQPVPAPAAAPALEVTVNGPTSATVGERVQFQISVTNRGSSTATGLLVTDRFDPGLEHAQSQNSIAHDLVDLQPGASAQLTVSLRVSQPGELCQNIEVTGAGGLSGTARHCLSAASPPIEQPAPGEQRWEPESPGVQPFPAQPTPAESPDTQPGAAVPGATPRPAGGVTLSVRKSGPDRRGVGETALFTIQVTNQGTTPIEDVVIADNFETTLEPTQATEGNEWLEGRALGWRVGTLAPQESVRRDIEFRCLQATPRACNRVTVTARGMQPSAEEACLEITAAPTGGAGAAGAAEADAAEAARRPLSVTVAETADPIRVGSGTTYQILVENKDAQSYFDVTVSATLSEELKLDTIASPVGTAGQVLPGSVRFAPVRELRAGEAPLSFELHTTGVRPGAAVVKVEVTRRGQSEAVKAEQTTQVLP